SVHRPIEVQIYCTICPDIVEAGIFNIQLGSQPAADPCFYQLPHMNHPYLRRDPRDIVLKRATRDKIHVTVIPFRQGDRRNNVCCWVCASFVCGRRGNTRLSLNWSWIHHHHAAYRSHNDQICYPSPLPCHTSMPTSTARPPHRPF